MSGGRHPRIGIPPPGGGPWTPADMVTSLWLDAADGSTVIVVNGKVTEWQDKSGNARHATQSTATRSPTYNLTGLNGRGTLDFVAANAQCLFVEGYLPFNTSADMCSIAIVARHTTTSSGGFISTRDSLTPGGPGGGFTFRLTNPNLMFFHVQHSPNMVALASLNPLIGTVARNGLDVRLGVNGGTPTNATTTGFVPNTTGRTYIGMEGTVDSTGMSHLSGLEAEIVISQVIWTDSSRQKVEGYLAHKWGLAADLPADHPYKAAPPMK